MTEEAEEKLLNLFWQCVEDGVDENAALVPERGLESDDGMYFVERVRFDTHAVYDAFPIPPSGGVDLMTRILFQPGERYAARVVADDVDGSVSIHYVVTKDPVVMRRLLLHFRKSKLVQGMRKRFDLICEQPLRFDD